MAVTHNRSSEAVSCRATPQGRKYPRGGLHLTREWVRNFFYKPVKIVNELAP